MNYRIAVPVLVLLGMMPWAELPAQGQTATTTFQVTARVNAVCQITANNLDFGAYNPKASSPHQVTTLLKATCTPQATYNIGLNAGTSPSATVTTRKMVSGANTLNYQLFSDSGRSTNWGDTTGTDTVTGSGTGLAVDHTVYGAIPAGQSTAAAGNYSDTITVTVYY